MQTPMHFWTYIYYNMFCLFLISEKGKIILHMPGLGCSECTTIHEPFQTSETRLESRVCRLELCHVTNKHAWDRFLDVLFRFLFAMFLEPHSYRSYQTHSLLYGTAICMSGPEFLKTMSYNTSVSVCLTIFGLLACFRVHILLSTFRFGS